MGLHTLTLREAETRLQELVFQTRATHRPVVLTTEETAEPLAVLVESSVFETLRRREQQLFHLQSRRLLRRLEDVEQQWEDAAARQKFVTTFQAGTRALWDVCPEGRRGLCVTLDMAARRLALERLTLPQVEALHTCLDLLRAAFPSKAAVKACHQHLIECGLSPTMVGDESLVQLYVDEL